MDTVRYYWLGRVTHRTDIDRHNRWYRQDFCQFYIYSYGVLARENYLSLRFLLILHNWYWITYFKSSTADKQISSEYHNRPLYIIGFVPNVEIRWGLVDPWSFLNITPLSTVEAVGIPQGYMAELSIEVSRYGGWVILGYIIVGLAVRSIQITTRLHIIGTHNHVVCCLEDHGSTNITPSPPPITNTSRLYREARKLKWVRLRHLSKKMVHLSRRRPFLMYL